MSLMMSSLHYQRAPLALRETLAFSGSQTEKLLRRVLQQPGVEGAVLLSTCNRTELYVTGDCGTPWRLLCRCADMETAGLENAFDTAAGEDAARHLMEVTCGLHSQIWGEDQILTQVRRAMELSQNAETANPDLSALFRMAVTVGKRVRTEIPMHRTVPSIGTQCRSLLEEALGDLTGKRLLVIGNGQMGQLAAQTLQQAGAAVSVTLRTYRHGTTTIPPGCNAIAYDRRGEAMEGLDGVISTTTSPHYTLTAEMLRRCKTPPRILVDLAVPRDMEPACGDIPGVTLYDMDSLGGETANHQSETQQIEAQIDRQMEELRRWKRRQQAASRGEEKPFRFPLFVDLSGKRVALVGGGTIASRRIGTLRLFGCEIVVISPNLKGSADGLTWISRTYQPGDLAGAVLAIAATDDREVNRQVGEDARTLGIPVSVADCEEECTFFFPAICAGEQVIAGVVSRGKDHHATARAAKQIRTVLEELP